MVGVAFAALAEAVGDTEVCVMLHIMIIIINSGLWFQTAHFVPWGSPPGPNYLFFSSSIVQRGEGPQCTQVQCCKVARLKTGLPV